MICSHHVYSLAEFLDVPSQTIVLHIEPLLRNSSASSEAVVHFILSTPPQTNTRKCLVHRIYWKCLVRRLKKRMFLTFSAPSNTHPKKSITFTTYRLPSFSQQPETSTKLFFFTPEDTNLSVKKNLCNLLTYFTGSLMNSLSKLTSNIIWIYSTIRYPDFSNVSRPSVSKIILPFSAATLRTSVKNFSRFSP